MSSIRVYLSSTDQDRWVDVEDGYSMLVEDDGSLGVYDDGDAILALFKTWDHAVNVPVSSVLAPTRIEDYAADEEDEEDDQVLNEEAEEDDGEDVRLP